MRSGSFLQTVRKALVATVLAAVLWAQNNSKVDKVEPVSVKVGDSVTLLGESLGKKTVVAVFLSTDKDDFAATIVEQTDTKIVIKAPKVKPGAYRVGIQVGNAILIQPISFTVEQ